jgi:repressor LexA
VNEPLTPLERKVYHYLIDFLAQNTFQPSLREIGRRFKIGSTKTVMNLLKRLEAKGYIERGVSHSRGVRIKGYAGPGGAQAVPLYSRANAAPPMFREEDVVRYYTLDRRLLPSDDAFLARVIGDAVATRGVFDGDIVIVNPTARASEEEIVALRLGEWIHVCVVRRAGAFLAVDIPGEGETMLDRSADYSVLGVVTGVLRAPDTTAD